MKKMLLGLTAVFAMSAAVPAFANDDKPAPEKKAPKKGGKKDKEDKPKEDKPKEEKH